jgi:protein-S-isoprenylcysteine O-methyltransferase Ste14
MPPVYLAVAVGVMAVLHEFVPVARLFGSPGRWLGFVPMAAAIFLGGWARWLFSKHQTTIRPGQTSRRLVTEGPFRWTRNPIYVGMVMVLAGVAIRFGSLSPWVMVPIFIVVIARNVIPVEEVMLQETFGAEYEQSRGRVPRWI